MPGARTLVLTLALVAALAGAGRADAALARGMDISHWQGAIDWFQVAGGGYSFVFAKATEGTTVTDPTYAINRSGAASIGLRLGAYHFARPGGSGDAGIVANAIAQADGFVQVATPKPGDLPPVLDLESRGSLTAPQLTSWTQAWLDQVERRVGAKAVVYASPSFWKTSLADTNVFAAGGFRLWVAHWTKSDSPLVPGGNWGGVGWSFWQWTDCTAIPGFKNCLDGDRFNGASTSAVAIPTLPATLATVVTAPSVVGTPQAGKLLAAVPGRWNGGRPLAFAYQWQRCDAAGAGCLPISGATRESYTPVAADAGYALVVSVTASGTAGSATAVSAPTFAVASGGGATATAPVAKTLPSIVGTVQAGQVLTGSVGAWTGSPTGFAYQWRRCDPAGAACAAIDGAAATQYTVSPGDIGSTLSLVVTATGKGGSRSAVSPLSLVVAAAPLPEPAVGSAVAAAGAAGAVTTADRAATITWQPGAVPAGASVSLAAASSKLPLPGTSFTVGASAALAWPIDLQYATAPADAVVGRLEGGRGVWQSVPLLPSAALPAGQPAGAYRDAAGALHVLARAAGQVALFEPGAWGDPARVPSIRPTLQRLTGTAALVPRRRADGSLFFTTRVIVTGQARLTATILGPNGTRPRILRTGSRLGTWLAGGPAKTVATTALAPGGLPVRIRVKALRPGVTYRLLVRSVDPYNRKASLVLPVRLS